MMKTLLKHIHVFWNDTSGATAIEYGLLAALISVTMISAVTCVGKSVDANLRCTALAMQYEGYFRTDEGVEICVALMKL